MAEGWIGREPRVNEEDLRQWCANMNRSHLCVSAGWWYYVRRDDNGVFRIHKIEGIHADEARARAAGKPVSYYKPTPGDLASINAFIADCRPKGVSTEEFGALVDRSGGAPRK